MSTKSNSSENTSKEILFSEYVRKNVNYDEFYEFLSSCLARIYNRDLAFMSDMEFSDFAINEVGLDVTLVENAITKKQQFNTPKHFSEMKL